MQGFDEAVTYILRAVGKECIVLKTEQLEAIRHIYDRKDVFLWLPTGFGRVYVMRCSRLCSTTSSNE